MTALWTAPEAAAATGGRTTGDWAVTGVSIDTRTLQPGDLFVALTAARDGHDFLAAALARGAGAALVSRVPDGVASDAPLLVVDDVQAALESLGRAGRARTAARVVAVTGSVGKTSTKEMLSAMLGDQGRTHASVASYNNHWGVPLTLARMPRDSDFAVIEIGMNHPGEIAPLARQARPHVALITTVAAAHLEAFDSIEAIAAEKAAILDGLEPGGVAVLNADIPEAPILWDKAAACGAAVPGFGRSAQDYRLIAAEPRGDATAVSATIHGRPVAFTLNTAGAHFAMNALGALAAVAALGADEDRAMTSLGQWTPVKGRGARRMIPLDGGALTLIDDSYNANPASMAAALAVLAAADRGSGRRIAILGDMKELGPQGAALHGELAALPAMDGIDLVHCVGPLMETLHASLPDDRRGHRCATAAEMAERLRDGLKAGDIVLVKGSLSTGLGLVVDAIAGIGHGAPHAGKD
jgi:UDP-N-acetylmuramoyl-tripeptide--D-alanyl-D-alanine ligase